MTSTMGLDGVVVAQTLLSDVDGVNGRLIVRGKAIDAWAGHVPFETLAERLWEGFAPAPEAGAIGKARVAAFDRLQPFFAASAAMPPLEGVRLGLAALRDDEAMPAHLMVTGAIAVMLAAGLRLRAGAAPVPPDPGAGHAADFLRMATGRVPSPEEAAALDAYLVTVAEHGMNASTFTARVIASTRAGLPSAVIGALGALKGPLHGGAPGPVLDMLDAIGEPARIRPWLEAQLAAGERLMGFGHRIYRVRDPRADVLKGVVARLRAGGNPRLAFAEHVEREALAALAAHKPERPLDTNVEFYTALLLEALGLPREAFTAVFAMGRVAGWAAHVFEQERDGRLMRPQSEYIGPRPV